MNNGAALFSVFVAGAHNAFTRFLLCCLKCCFWCLERFIKFMNRNAYIMVSHSHFFKVQALHNFIFDIFYNYQITAYIFSVDSFICLNMNANVEPVLSRNRLTERRNALTFIVRFDSCPQISIYGKNFCSSARDAFFLLMRNVMR